MQRADVDRTLRRASMKRRPLRHRVGFAAAGIREAWRREPSLRTQVILAAGMLVMLATLNPELVWWAIFIVVGSLVIAAEMVNSALEALIDHLHPDRHPEIRVVKDMAAGAVLIFSVSALVIGVLFVGHLAVSRLASSIEHEAAGHQVGEDRSRPGGFDASVIDASLCSSYDSSHEVGRRAIVGIGLPGHGRAGVQPTARCEARRSWRSSSVAC
jgi:undecaprenol kinase